MEFSPIDLWLLRIRTGCKTHIKSVCEVHLDHFIKNYPSHQRCCCNPLKLHKDAEDSQEPPAKKKKVKAGLNEINLKLRKAAREIFLSLIPGKKICISCKVKLNAEIAMKRKEREEAAKKGEPVSIPQLESSPSFHSSQASATSSKKSVGSQFTVTDTIDPTSKNYQPFTINTLDGFEHMDAQSRILTHFS